MGRAFAITFVLVAALLLASAVYLAMTDPPTVAVPL